MDSPIGLLALSRTVVDGLAASAALERTAIGTGADFTYCAALGCRPRVGEGGGVDSDCCVS